MKTLNNEQRIQLQKLADSEFDIRRRELVNASKTNVDDWIMNELTKINKESKLVRLKAIKKEESDIYEHYHDRGINLNNYKATGLSVGCKNGYDSIYHSKPYKGYQETQDKLGFKQDAFERAKNSVLAIIWSMEKPFDECMKLIKDTVNKL